MTDAKTDHPLGDLDGTGEAPAAVVEMPSIVDTILNLDEFLSGDVRRAERTARFATRPDLEADIDELDAQLEMLTDGAGNPLDSKPERALGEEGGASADQLADKIKALQIEYGASFRSVRLRQMAGDDWTAFQSKWRKELDAGSPFPDSMWDDLIVECAYAPAFTLAKIQKLRTMIGFPQVNAIAMAAWQANTQSGVSIPKSPLSSAVLRRRARATS